MDYPVEDIFDRYSILLLHRERGEPDQQTLAEIERFSNEVKHIIEYGYVLRVRYSIWLDQLTTINGAIWSLESAVRKGKDKELGLEEIGSRAVGIREWNRLRLAVKAEIAKAHNRPVVRKYDHASA